MNIGFVLHHNAIHGGWNVPLAPTKRHILLLMMKGKLFYEIEGKKLTLEKGEVLFMRQGTLRSTKEVMEDPHVIYAAYFVDVSAEELGSLADAPFTRFRPHGFDYFRQRFALLHETWVGKLPGSSLIARGILMELLGIVQRDQFAGSRSASSRSLVLQIQDYIIRHYREPLQIRDIADYVERTPNYVSSVFKQVTNRSPITYMHEVRIAAARDLLMTTNMTIGEIADSLGYCDQTYFNYMFKKIVGHPPSHTLKLRQTQ